MPRLFKKSGGVLRTVGGLRRKQMRLTRPTLMWVPASANDVRNWVNRKRQGPREWRPAKNQQWKLRPDALPHPLHLLLLPRVLVLATLP